MDKIRFLMSDTGAEITAQCREALEQKGVEVTVVEKDGMKVLQKMLSIRPQVVLLDAFMPGLDALAVAAVQCSGGAPDLFLCNGCVSERRNGAGAAGRRVCLLFCKTL